MSIASFCSNNCWPFPLYVTSMTALPSGGIEPEVGLINHCPILSPVSYFPPLPPFLAYFLTYFASFFAPPFLGSALTADVMLLAASNLTSLSFLMFSKIYFLTSSLSLSKIV